MLKVSKVSKKRIKRNKKKSMKGSGSDRINIKTNGEIIKHPLNSDYNTINTNFEITLIPLKKIIVTSGLSNFENHVVVGYNEYYNKKSRLRLFLLPCPRDIDANNDNENKDECLEIQNDKHFDQKYGIVSISDVNIRLVRLEILEYNIPYITFLNESDQEEQKETMIEYWKQKMNC